MAIDKVAYVVICWNNKDLMKECLEAIEAQTYEHKVIYVIDNASSDGSADYIAENFPGVKLIRSTDNTGFAKGNNIVIKEALKDEEVKYIALVNSDAILDKNWTNIIVSEAKRHSRVAGLQGITIDYFNRHLVDSHHVYVAENFQSVQYGYKELYNENSYFTRQIMGVNAAAAIYTRAFIEEQPFDYFFDESFFMYLEDVDVSLRARILGWDNLFVAGAKAYHMGSASSNKRSSDFSLYYTARNQFALLFKNFPFKVIRKQLKTALKFEVHFIRHLKRVYGSKTTRTYLKGRTVGFLRIGLYIVKRATIQSRRKLSSDRIVDFMHSEGQ